MLTLYVNLQKCSGYCTDCLFITKQLHFLPSGRLYLV